MCIYTQDGVILARVGFRHASMWQRDFWLFVVYVQVGIDMMFVSARTPRGDSVWKNISFPESIFEVM